MDDYDDRQYRTPLMSYGDDGGRSQSANKTKNKVPADPRPEFGVTVVEESGLGITKDITAVHSDWKTGKKGPGVELYVPGPKREAVAWQAVHTYFAYDGAEMFVCNICGKDLKLSGTAGAISSHLKRKHPGIKEKMEEVERRNMKKKRKRTELPLASGKSKNPSQHNAPDGNAKMIPFPRDVQAPQPIADKPLSSSKKSLPRGLERKAAAVRAQKQAQIMYLIGEGLPFFHVESRWHRNLLETTVVASRVGAIAPQQLEFSTKDVTTRVFVAARKLRDRLKERIMGKVLCGSTNHWTSRQHVAYVSFSVQWIEDFTIESAVLAVYILRGGGVGHARIQESVLQDLASKLEYWELGRSMKFLISDREVKMNAFGLSMEKMIGTENISCLDYMLNLVARKAFEGALGVDHGEDYGEFDGEDDCDDTDTDVDGEDDIPDAKRATTKKGLLPKVRKLVGHFESSIQASDELMMIAKQLCGSEEERDALKHLAQDVSTSWWSTQNMLERLFALREATTTYVARKWMPGATTKENRPPRLTEDEWEALEELHFMLRPLRFAQQMLQGRQSMSSSSFVPLVVHLIYQELETVYREESNNTSVKTIAKEMLVKMDELFGSYASRDNTASPPLGVVSPQNNDKSIANQVKFHKAILIAHALDPRFKPLSVFPSEVQEQIWSDLLDEMIKLGPIIACEGEQDEKKEEENENDAQPSRTGELDALLQLYSAQQERDVAQRKPQNEPKVFDSEDWARKCEVELKQYQETKGMEPKMDSDVVRLWWGDESRSSMYPVLWRLAQRVLCINATSTPAHRAFCLSQNSAVHNRCKMGTGDECLHLLYENYHRLEEEGIWIGSELL